MYGIILLWNERLNISFHRKMWSSKIIREIFSSPPPIDGLDIYISSAQFGKSMFKIKNWKVDWEWKNVVFQSGWRRTLLKNNKSIFISLRQAYPPFVFPQQASIHNRTSLYQFIDSSFFVWNCTYFNVCFLLWLQFTKREDLLWGIFIFSYPLHIDKCFSLLANNP